jgi:hypothetical protein
MLEVRGAVAEKRREANIEPPIQMPENVILQAIEQARPTPTNPRIAPFRCKLTNDGSGSTDS